MLSSEPDLPHEPENSGPQATPTPTPPVDLPALAAQLYALLKEEVRLERERSGARSLR